MFRGSEPRGYLELALERGPLPERVQDVIPRALVTSRTWKTHARLGLHRPGGVCSQQKKENDMMILLRTSLPDTRTGTRTLLTGSTIKLIHRYRKFEVEHTQGLVPLAHVPPTKTVE